MPARWPATPQARAFAAAACLGIVVACAMAWFESGRVGTWFYDPDDALRLVMVRDWLAGQPWGDVWQHRLQPGGTQMHWSRVDDLPVAGVIVALRGWLGQDGAERVAMTLWPVALVPAVFGTVAAAGGGGTRVSAAALTCCSGALLYRFMPGRIDHHALMTTATVVACCTLLLGRGWGWGALAGASTALCLAVGFEDLAVLATLGAGAAALWAVGGERDYPLGYGTGLAAGMAVAEVAFVPDGTRTATACDCLSGGWVPAVALAGAGLALAAARGGWLARPARITVTAGMGVLPAFVLALTGAGKCLSGPYPMLSETAKRYWLDQVGEMRDLVAVAHGDPGIYATQCLAIALAVLASAAALRRGWRPSAREACYAAVLAVAAAFGERYVRNSGLPVALAAPVVARAVPAAAWRARRTTVAAVAVLAASAVPGGLLLSEMYRDAAAAEASAGRLDCESRDAWVEVAAFPAGTAAVPVDLGPEALAYTPHSVLAAGIHRASDGIDDMRRLMTGSEREALEVVDRDGLDYVVWCGALTPGLGEMAALGNRIAAGKLPGWLEPVPGDGPIRIALVVKYKAAKALVAARAPLPMAPAVAVPPPGPPTLALPPPVPTAGR